MPNRAIKAIFFTRFHHEKGAFQHPHLIQTNNQLPGSRVLHQVPEGSITPCASPSALHAPLFTFSSITSYLIPNQQFCDRLLTFCTNRYRVIGYPVCIREGKYSRNEFIFNLACVVDEGLADWVAYGEVVRKLGRLLRGLEEQGGFLSGEEDAMGVWEDDHYESEWWRDRGKGAFVGGGSKVHALCENVLEDLNNYAECMIPIGTCVLLSSIPDTQPNYIKDDSNTINLKLFPTRAPPPPIHAHTVPLLTISLSTLSRPLSSDLTLARILPHINGINSVSHIAQLADTDLSLTRKAIQHLVYYGCLVLLDVFNFGAVYAPTAEIGGFISDEAVLEECGRYVRAPRTGLGTEREKEREKAKDSDNSLLRVHSGSDSLSSLSSQSQSQPSSTSNPSTTTTTTTTTTSTPANIPPTTLITLYTTLRQGLPLSTWILENLTLLHGIDIRRLITFGVIKGFLYRVHKYALATHVALPPAPPTSLQSVAASDVSVASTDAEPDAGLGSRVSGLAEELGGVVAGVSVRHKPSFLTGSNTNTATATATTMTSSSGNTTTGTVTGATASTRPEDVTRLDNFRTMGGGVDVPTSSREQGLPLIKFLDGMHCFDEICTELGMSEKVVETKVKSVGEVQVFSR
jgi:hypothetical protein